MILQIDDAALLTNLSFFDNETTLNNYRNVTKKSIEGYRAVSSFNEVSDWNNRHRTNPTYIQTETNESPKLKKNIFNRTMLARNRQSFCQSPKKKAIQLSPINVRFHLQSSNGDSKSERKEKFRVRETTGSIYDHHHKLLTQLYQLKMNELKKVKVKPSQEKSSPFKPQQQEAPKNKFPRTEMKSSIVRIMKKQQLIKTFRKRNFGIDSKKSSMIKSERSLKL